MKNYEYVPRSEWYSARKKIVNVIHHVQDEIREKFTFSYEFIGSSSRKMITREIGGNVGFDFDVNILLSLCRILSAKT